MSGGGAVPKPPDYVGQAETQGQYNIKAAQEQARLNNVNTNNPYGSTKFTEDPRTHQWTSNTTLNDGQQSLLDTQQANQLTGNNLAANALTKYGQQAGQGVNTSGYNPRTTSVAPSSFQTQPQSAGVQTTSLDTGSLAPRQSANYQGSLDLNGLASLPGVNDYSADRQKVEDTIYGMQAKKLDPQYQQQEDAMRTRLLNSGVREGSQAWNQQWNDFNQSRTAAYGDARDRSILDAGQEQSRMLNDALGIRNQQFGERSTAGNFANNASQLTNTQGLSARDQDYGEMLNSANFGNSASAQQLQAELAKMGFFNDTQGKSFDQSMQNADLGNSQRDAQFGEDTAQHSMSMQELMQMIGMTQGPSAAAVGPGGSGGGGGGQGIAPVDLTGATQSQYQAQLDQYNNNQAAKNSNTQAAGGIVSAALIAY
jgi:hypothetical protein